MNNICNAPLSYSFGLNEVPHYLGLAIGLVGIFGWGQVAERLVSRLGRVKFSYAHAYLSGVAVVAFMMSGFSLLGYCRPAFPIAITGLIIGGILMVRDRIPFTRIRESGISWSGLLMFIGIAVTVVAALPLVLFPARFGDLTAIWAFHGKALACECVAHSHFMRERVWAGTHPEYPLLLPFMDAYFFSLMDSYRDDIVNAWRILSILSCSTIIFRTISDCSRSAMAGLFCVLMFVYLSAFVDDSMIFFARAEIESTVFLTAAALVILTNEPARLWIYLAAMAYTKREAAVGSLLLVSVASLMMLTEKSGNWSAKALWTRVKHYLMPLAPVILILGLNALQPSLHEQYERKIFSIEAWRNGINHLHEIIEGCLGVILQSKFWTHIFRWALPVSIFFLFYKKRHDSTNRGDFRRIFSIWAWTYLMMGIFLAIYVVSPWGPGLYRITFSRLLEQVAMPTIITLALALGSLLSSHQLRLRVLGIVAMNLWCIPLYPRAIDLVQFHYNTFRELARKQRSGIRAFAHFSPEHERAFALDRVLPAAAPGALIDDQNYYTINYLLYPRRLYPTHPDDLAGTFAPWTSWHTSDPRLLECKDLQYAVKDWQQISSGTMTSLK